MKVSKRAQMAEAVVNEIKQDIYYTAWHNHIYESVLNILEGIKRNETLYTAIKDFCTEINNAEEEYTYLDDKSVINLMKAYPVNDDYTLEFIYKWIYYYTDERGYSYHDDEEYDDYEDKIKVIQGVQIVYKAKKLRDHSRTGIAYFTKFDIEEDIKRMEKLLKEEKKKQNELFTLLEEKEDEYKKFRDIRINDSDNKEYCKLNCHDLEKKIRERFAYASKVTMYCGITSNTKILAVITKVCKEDEIPLLLRIDGEIDQPEDSLGYYYSM